MSTAKGSPRGSSIGIATSLPPRQPQPTAQPRRRAAAAVAATTVEKKIWIWFCFGGREAGVFHFNFSRDYLPPLNLLKNLVIILLVYLLYLLVLPSWLKVFSLFFFFWHDDVLFKHCCLCDSLDALLFCLSSVVSVTALFSSDLGRFSDKSMTHNIELKTSQRNQHVCLFHLFRADYSKIESNEINPTAIDSTNPRNNR